MKIVIATNAGFCMGVRRAVEMAIDASKKYQGPIYTFGPLIHNPQVLKSLEDKGITVLDEIPEQGNGTVIIRAHGIPPGARKKLEHAGFNILNATCPRVIRVQSIIDRHSLHNFSSIIIGDKDHPEVVGLMGYTRNNGYVINSIEQLKTLPVFEKAIIVAQTTQNAQLVNEIKNFSSNRLTHYTFFDTICDSTEKRQAKVRQLARSVDAIVVVGGLNSGNTRRLVQIAIQAGKPAYHVETEADLDLNALSTAQVVGITAGASTPTWIISKVHQTLLKRFPDQPKKAE